MFTVFYGRCSESHLIGAFSAHAVSPIISIPKFLVMIFIKPWLQISKMDLSMMFGKSALEFVPPVVTAEYDASIMQNIEILYRLDAMIHYIESITSVLTADIGKEAHLCYFERYLVRNASLFESFSSTCRRRKQKRRFLERVENPDKN